MTLSFRELYLNYSTSDLYPSLQALHYKKNLMRLSQAAILIILPRVRSSVRTIGTMAGKMIET